MLPIVDQVLKVAFFDDSRSGLRLHFWNLSIKKSLKNFI